MMQDEDDDNPHNLTDFQAVKTVVVTGMAVEFTDSLVMFVGWTELPKLGGNVSERRIELRFGMPREIVADMHREIGKGLRKGSH